MAYAQNLFFLRRTHEAINDLYVIETEFCSRDECIIIHYLALRTNASLMRGLEFSLQYFLGLALQLMDSLR